MRVLFTPSAEQQIDDLYSYIGVRSGEAIAEGYVGRIVKFCESLASFPERGTKRDDVLRGLRTVGFERRVTIAFVVTPEAVLIEGVFYGGRDYEASFKRR